MVEVNLDVLSVAIEIVVAVKFWEIVMVLVY